MLTLVTKAGGVVVSYGCDAQNGRITGVSLSTVVESLTYDAFGAVEQRAVTAGGTPLFSVTYVRDAVGRLAERTEMAQGETHTDGFGRRVGKKIGGMLVKGWLYADALRLVAELDGTGAVVARFIYGEQVNVPEAMIKGGVTYRIVTDPLGSPRIVIDEISDGSSKIAKKSALRTTGARRTHDYEQTRAFYEE